MQPDFATNLINLMPRLTRRATRLVGARPGLGSPEDFVQDTLVTALQKHDAFDGDNLGGWLCAILEGHIRNASRKARVRTTVSLTIGDPESSNGAGTIGDVPVAPTQEITRECADVIEVLGTLSAEDQRIILLSRFEELSYEEVAGQLKLPLGTVKSKLNRALARLRAAYDAEPSALGRRAAAIPMRRAA